MGPTIIQQIVILLPSQTINNPSPAQNEITLLLPFLSPFPPFSLLSLSLSLQCQTVIGSDENQAPIAQITQMPSHIFSNSIPVPSDRSSNDASNDAVSLPSPPSSAASPFPPEMLSYLWIPFLISLSSPAKAESSTTETILLPSKLGRDSVSSQSCPAPDSKLNYRPVIGILSHPGDGASGRLSNASTASYIAASYVKFVESAGARVIPIIYNEPLDVIYQVNRFFFFSIV